MLPPQGAWDSNPSQIPTCALTKKKPTQKLSSNHFPHAL